MPRGNLLSGIFNEEDPVVKGFGLTLLFDLNLGVVNSSTSEQPLRNQGRRWLEVLETEGTLFGEERLLEEQASGGGSGGVARYGHGSRGRHG